MRRNRRGRTANDCEGITTVTCTISMRNRTSKLFHHPTHLLSHCPHQPQDPSVNPTRTRRPRPQHLRLLTRTRSYRTRTRAHHRTRRAVVRIQEAIKEVVQYFMPSMGDVDVGAAPARLLRPPSIAASTRSTVGSKHDDAPKGSTRPAAGATNTGSAEDTAQVAVGVFSS